MSARSTEWMLKLYFFIISVVIITAACVVIVVLEELITYAQILYLLKLSDITSIFCTNMIFMHNLPCMFMIHLCTKFHHHQTESQIQVPWNCHFIALQSTKNGNYCNTRSSIFLQDLLSYIIWDPTIGGAPPHATDMLKLIW